MAVNFPNSPSSGDVHILMEVPLGGIMDMRGARIPEFLVQKGEHRCKRTERRSWINRVNRSKR